MIPSPPLCEPGPSHPSPHPAPAGILPSAFSSTSLSAPPAPAFPVPAAAVQPLCRSVLPHTECHCWHLSHGVPTGWLHCPGRRSWGAFVTLSPCRDHKAVPSAPLGQAVSVARAHKHSADPALAPSPSLLLCAPHHPPHCGFSSSPEPRDPCQSLACCHCPCQQSCRHPDRPGCILEPTVPSATSILAFELP